MSIFDDNKDVWLPDFRWIFEAEDPLAPDYNRKRALERAHVMKRFLETISKSMTPLDTEIYGIMFTIANDNVYFLVRDIHGRRMYKLCSRVKDVFHKMSYDTHGSLFYEQNAKVYKLPETLCESFNYIRRYWQFFSVCGDHYFGRECWIGKNFRTERKYKKHLKYGDNDRKSEI